MQCNLSIFVKYLHFNHVFFSFLTKTVVVEIKVQTYMWPFKISAAKKTFNYFITSSWLLTELINKI